MRRIKDALPKMDKLQEKRLLKVFDGSGDDQKINDMVAAVTADFRRVELKIQQVVSAGSDEDGCQKGARVRENAQKGLATELKTLSMEFKNRQTKYMNDLQRRQAGAKGLLDEEAGGPQSRFIDTGFTASQMEDLDLMESNVGQRSEDIAKIAQSISDLHGIFKELAVHVIDQGTVLDRIDYNIEQVVYQSQEANTQLRKAEQSQKNNRAMKCIFALVIANLILIVILIMKHAH